MAEPAAYDPVAQLSSEADAQVETQAQLTAANLNAIGVDRPMIEADSSAGDSAYGESTTSSFLTSIASEVTRGLYENGRRCVSRLCHSHT